MKRFHVNQRPDEKFIEVKKRVQICHVVQIDEEFNVGTSHGIAHGMAGDYLLMDGSALSVVREKDFDIMYELVNPKKEKVETPEKVAKKSSEEIYQKPKEVKKVEKKVVKPVVKKVKPVTKKAVPKKKVAKKKKK